MNFRLAIIYVFGLTLFVADPTTCPPGTIDDAKSSASVLADFAVKFYKQVSATTEEKNAVMSPISVALAMAMLESGADGATRQQLKTVLVGTADNSQVLKTYQTVQKYLNISTDDSKLSVANSLFVQKNFQVKQDYATSIRNCFNGEVENLDFSGQSESSRLKINKWISDKTSNRIPELFKPGVLTPNIVLILANAIYFKGSWNNPFAVTDTRSGIFYRFGRNQDTQSANFMRQTALFRYASDENVEVLDMSYSNHDLSMYIILPKAKDGLRSFEQQLTGEKLKSLLASTRRTWLDVMLPRFSIRSPIDLKQILSNVGLEKVFSDSADFGRLSSWPLKVSKAKHEAYINVNENGTEALAATGFGIAFRSGPPRNPQQFIADHPFIFALKHIPTSSVVFLGKVNFIEENVH